MSQTTKIKLIDRVLVEVKTRPENNEAFRESDSGILLPNEDAKNKAFNFGRIVAIPYMWDDKYEKIADSITVDDIVFFSANQSYNFLPQDDDKIKLLMIPLWDIDAIYSG